MTITIKKRIYLGPHPFIFEETIILSLFQIGTLNYVQIGNKAIVFLA